MTTTAKILLICSLAGACALAFWPRAAGGVNARRGNAPAGFEFASCTACAPEAIGIWLGSPPGFERIAQPARNACATRRS
jgi:hypothetical protein